MKKRKKERTKKELAGKVIVQDSRRHVDLPMISERAYHRLAIVRFSAYRRTRRTFTKTHRTQRAYRDCRRQRAIHGDDSRSIHRLPQTNPVSRPFPFDSTADARDHPFCSDISSNFSGVSVKTTRRCCDIPSGWEAHHHSGPCTIFTICCYLISVSVSFAFSCSVSHPYSCACLTSNLNTPTYALYILPHLECPPYN